MGKFKSLSMTFFGLLIFVILPGFVIVSNHLEKSMPVKDIRVTSLSGNAHVQYEVIHRVDPTDPKSPRFKARSPWIPIEQGMKIGSGALIHTADRAQLDLMTTTQVGIRMKGKGLARLQEGKGDPKPYDLNLQYGKVFCRVAPEKQKKMPKLKIYTPTAQVQVKGTSFAVDYEPEKGATLLDVLDGLVQLAAANVKEGVALDVGEAQAASVSTSNPVPALNYLSETARQELLEARDLKLDPDLMDNWNRTLEYVTESPIYRKAMEEITKYEMKVFIRAMRYFAPLRWNNNLPARLEDVQLEDGDYQDPWGTDYLYRKLGAQKALLISAGPDGVQHTTDDIVMSIASLSEEF